MHRPPLSPGGIRRINFFEAESTPGPQYCRKDYVNEKNPIRDIPACNAEPQRTASSRAPSPPLPHRIMHPYIYIYILIFLAYDGEK